MNERIENILKHDLTIEQTEWMLQSFQQISFDSTITCGVNTSGFWVLHIQRQACVKLLILIRLLDCIVMSRKFHISVTVVMRCI